ncbi:hypothetical protein ABIF65_006848 [Bradyrhizobium japonicum]|nr:hypothetical protein [Bradyrhizobium japonicum]MCP1775986.1 hypothetical protein [Bradyrhizobium japonicum]MCP1862800.1 hypothetical protein [Bradyrhizobium japonicum]MCP1893654.1 hypothetical protein [Bradyrhizobium japonicum]MCP1961015.1 hypothetical protein [Bradyrhizobium japonicum]
MRLLEYAIGSGRNAMARMNYRKRWKPFSDVLRLVEGQLVRLQHSYRL